MQYARTIRRSVLLALTLLSACAASDPSSDASTGRIPGGVIGNYLAGRYALSSGEADAAATDLLRALAQAPDDPELTQQAFLACLEAGRPEASTLARQLPDNQIAQLVLADADAKAGRWGAVEERLHALPRQGLIQLLQPLLLAWAQLGAGRTDAALQTLQPFVDDQRLQSVFALHAGMIADLGGRADQAAKYFGIVVADMLQPNLRTAQILASWAARSGQPAEAQRFLGTLPSVAPDLAITLPALAADVTTRPVASPTDGMAEAYFTFAGMLQSQNADELALIIQRLSLDLRPGFTAARLLGAELLSGEHYTAQALDMLAPVRNDDPVASIVRLRRAMLLDHLGRDDEAMRTLDQLAHDFPASPLPDEARGDLLRQHQKFSEAASAYDRAVQRLGTLTENDWAVFYDRGVAEERSHEWPKAKADFDKALELAPDQPYVLNYLGYSWADAGSHLDEARNMIEKAARARPNDGAITDSLGWVLLRQGHADQAVQVLEKAVEMEPEDPTINGHLGDAYEAVGRKIEALYQWRRALTLNPEADDKARLEAKLAAAGNPGAVANGQ